MVGLCTHPLQQYAKSSIAEDNPNNEYPDEDISSDDEVGTNVYRYRRNCSDDEQYGEDDDDS